MIAITERPEGCILPVRVQPNSRKPGIYGEQSGALKVAVAAPPEHGRANKALIEILREALGVKRSQIELMSGASSREKKILIREMERKQLIQRISSMLAT